MCLLFLKFKSFLIRLLPTLVVVCLMKGVAFAAPSSGTTPVIVQLFNWTFEQVEKEVPLLASLGYTHVHVSPPQLSIDKLEWWGRYQPIDYRVIDGPLGNEAQFKSMIDVAHRSGVKIIADVVLNHMANFDYMEFGVKYNESAPEVLEYPNHRFRLKYDLSVLFTPEHFNPTGCITNWNNRFMVLHHRLCVSKDRGLPDLNLNHPHVLQVHRDYLTKLKNLGVDGFRIDAIKHMPETYFEKLFAGNLLSKDMLVFGESITTQADFKTSLEPYLRATRMRFYDFPLLQKMNESFEGGDLGKLIQPVMEEAALEDERAVTFVVNHDIPTNGDTFRAFLMPPAQETLAFAYIFARYDGIPYVFSDLGQHSLRHAFYHRRSDIAGMIQFRKLTDRTPLSWVAASRERLAWTRGTHALAVLNNANTKFTLTQMKTNLVDGEYYDLISAYKNNGQSKIWIKVMDSQIVAGEVPSYTAALLIRK